MTCRKIDKREEIHCPNCENAPVECGGCSHYRDSKRAEFFGEIGDCLVDNECSENFDVTSYPVFACGYACKLWQCMECGTKYDREGGKA